MLAASGMLAALLSWRAELAVGDGEVWESVLQSVILAATVRVPEHNAATRALPRQQLR